jgi:hypothetical protein
VQFRQGMGRTRESGRPGAEAKPNMDRRRVEQAAVTWTALNAVFVIIWAMSGRGPFWPGGVMLLSAVHNERG